MSKEITSKSTKAEILKAYNEAIQKVNQKSPKEQYEVEQNTNIVNSVDKKIDNLDINSLSNSLTNFVQDLLNKIEEKKNDYKELTDAIDIKKEELKNIHGIETQAETLEALIIAHNKQKEEINNEINSLKIEKEEVKKDLAIFKKQQEVSIKQELSRYQDEQNYDLERTKIKELDNWEDKKNEKQKELNEIKEQINKLYNDKTKIEEMEEKIKSIPELIENAKNEALEDQKKQFAKQEAIKESYSNKNKESEKRIYESKIELLEQQLLDSKNQIKQLTDKLDEAYEKIQNIAQKTVEGQNNNKMFNLLKDKLNDNQK